MSRSLTNGLRSWIAPRTMRLNEFDEDCYLLRYPDVAQKVRSGQLQSGRQHYIRYGFGEDRQPGVSTQAVSSVECNYDVLKVTTSGAVFAHGWVNDVISPAVRSLIATPDGTASFETDNLYRHPREDIAALLHLTAGGYKHGLWIFNSSLGPLKPSDADVGLYSAEGLLSKVRICPELITDAEMRDFALGFFNTRFNLDNNQHADVSDLEKGLGNELIKLNRRIIQNNKRVGVRKFNSNGRRFTKSFIVCLYGAPEFLPLQVALFSQSARSSDAEFIFVNNSPEHNEWLERLAKQSARLYDVPITIVHAGENIGFGAANNLAAQHACSDRLLFMNPDVFPKDVDWIKKHDDFASIPAGTIFGARLYYNDGSAMHAGMHFVRESFIDGNALRKELLSTDHFAKGFPDWVDDVTTTRIVPAITGAFMSIDRSHFERLNGFDEDFVFGHYEDGDLCLRSTAVGQPIWYCADVKLWHMEGKGSKKLSSHEGAKRLNRWHLTHKWSSLADLNGGIPSFAKDPGVRQSAP